MRPRAITSTVVVALTIAACSSSSTPGGTRDDGAITIASFDFDESELIADLYAGALRAAGFPVRHIPRVGTREIVLPALERGLIDLVPEYTGSAMEFLGGHATGDPASTHDALRLALESRGIDVLTAAPAQSRNGLVVTAATAASDGLRRVSDLRKIAPRSTLGGPPECPDRHLCLPGLTETYGLEFGSFLPLDAGGPITAEAIRRGTVDVGVLFTSDGSLAEGDLVLLDDDRGLQPAENITPIVRRDAEAHFNSELVDVLDAVSRQLTTGELRHLNAAVRAGASPEDAAARWLSEHGLADEPS